MNTLQRCMEPLSKRVAQNKLYISREYETAIVLVLTVILALCVKLFYSTAGSADLKWILYPTTVLVQFFTSIEFLFDPAKGYVATEAPVVIGPGCAGLNFFVIALCMSVFSFAKRNQYSQVFLFLTISVLTYVVTVVANASRIIAGIVMLDFGEQLNFPVSDTLHTAQGTLFYFVFLLAYFVVLQAWFNNWGCRETIQ